MITKEQALGATEFHANGCTQTVGPRGGVKKNIEVWRRNGMTTTWKRNEAKFIVPIKYGLYGYGHITDETAQHFHVADDCPLLLDNSQED